MSASKTRVGVSFHQSTDAARDSPSSAIAISHQRPRLRHTNAVINQAAASNGSCITAMRNNAIKMRKRQNCCGNHGEPGC